MTDLGPPPPATELAGGAPGGGSRVPDPGDGSLPRFRIRYGRLTDVRALVRLYLGQSDSSRAMYHPFPFDPIRLTLIYLWLVLGRHTVRWTVRNLPSIASIIVVVVPDGTTRPARPIGYGTIRYVAAPSQETWAKVGYILREDCRGFGLGWWLAYRLMQVTLDSGVRLAGGGVLDSNTTNIALVKKLGFEPLAGAPPDRAAPGARTVQVLGDIRVRLNGLQSERVKRTGQRAIVVFEAPPPDS